MERWRNAHPATDDAIPLALAEEGPHGQVIAAVNAAARHGGARRGQRMTDARAILPTLAIAPADPAGDAAALAAMGRWAQRWSPWTAVDGADGLLLDTGGAAHLFGGEAAMLAGMARAFGALGHTSRIALAPTIGAAWALAHYGGKEQVVVAEDDLAGALAPLPIASLRIDADAVLLLRRLGIKTVGALRGIPTEALGRRFRKHRRAIANPLRRLQQAYGDVEEVVAPLAPHKVYRASARVLEPIRHVAVLEPVVADLAADLAQQLEEAHLGLRRARFEAFRIDGHIAQLEVETAAPVRAPAHVVRLFSEKLDGLDAGFGFDAFALTALWHEQMDALQKGLEEDEAPGISFAHLIDRLRVRLGAGNVRLAAPCASHVPERSIVWQEDMGAPGAFGEILRDRPIRLFDRPEPVTVIYATPDGPPRRFRWRRQLHDVARSEGPERIAPEWWRERSEVRLRDYYKVEDEAGRRLWIYRSGVVGDGRGGPPQWFVHGLFA